MSMVFLYGKLNDFFFFKSGILFLKVPFQNTVDDKLNWWMIARVHHCWLQMGGQGEQGYVLCHIS